MSLERKSIHGQWSGRLAFILAATGSAVGLGNIWKFPYITGENGGGAFVLVYLVCIALIGIPIMMGEILLGRRGRQNPVHTMQTLAEEAGSKKAWGLLGWMGVLAGFLILSYYSVVAGWALAYVLEAVKGSFVQDSAEAVTGIFGNLVSSPGSLIFWHTMFMTMTMIIVARGVQSGLEKAVKWLMPGLFVILVLLVGYAMAQGNFTEGLAFLFNPDFSKLNQSAVLTAMGHAFFTLSLGMGAIMIYGSYLPGNVSIAKTSVLVALADTVVALLAGMAIFPIVFANGLEPGAGPGLVFQTLPIAFGQMPGGLIIGVLFFVMLSFAAWSSAISLIEPAVTWLVENRNISRYQSCVVAGIITWTLGIASALSFNLWGDFKLFDKNFFDLIDYLTANIMLPFGGFLIAIFVGWIMHKEHSRGELQMVEGNLFYRVWLFAVRFIAPLSVLIVFLRAIGIID